MATGLKKKSAAYTPAQIAAKEKKLAAEIARRNKLFKAASKQEKRVLIAKDVIAQIRANRYTPKSRTWLNMWTQSGKFIDPYELARTDYTELTSADLSRTGGLNPEDQTRDAFLRGDISKCSCCALGGILMSCTLYNDHQKLKNVDRDTDIEEIIALDEGFTNGLHKFFSRQQLALIECAFEGGRGWFLAFREGNRVAADNALLQNVPKTTLLNALKYKRKYRSTSKRMITIMQNIIRNNGTFTP